ncbi:hypothetical protein [Pedobacter jejuensis]|uniref:Uncharacterized protein n=1 Tax=Pedobacter jejuensis TaxID=1268550 RepID=A0A3N0C0I8_9SPHI|nr:hypothetical protein [Pedobacter jejuensis]RNL55702.1 hypothetical protein D7004_02790 [Pedobacter jejuensis]
MKKILALSLFVAVISGCTSMKTADTATRVTATGKIETIGMTTYQYGTHILKAENKTYALKGGSINLDQYLDKTITIKGRKVAGYPINGGPDLVDVTLIKF